jgi:cytoskeleton protein RodZ
MMMPSSSSCRANFASPGRSVVGEFGDKFRNEREKKGFSLDDVSNVTKIGSRMLQAIEEEHFDQLPGGVFNKGFIRAYAKHLGLNDAEAVTEYLACLRQAQIDAQASWQPPARAAAPEKRATPAPANRASNSPPPPPPSAPETIELPELQLPRAEHVRPPRRNYLDRSESGIPWGIVAASAVIIVLAAVLWHRHSGGAHTQAAAGTPSASSAPLQPGAATTSAPLASSQPTSSTQQSTSAAAPAGHPSSSATPLPSTPDADNNTASESATPAPKAKTTAALKLEIRASENSWISVSADGQVVSQETLIAPAHTSVRASRELIVRVGNAAGISFLFNGKEIPPQGGESEFQTLVFDSSGLKTAQPAPAPTTAN